MVSGAGEGPGGWKRGQGTQSEGDAWGKKKTTNKKQGTSQQSKQGGQRTLQKRESTRGFRNPDVFRSPGETTPVCGETGDNGKETEKKNTGQNARDTRTARRGEGGSWGTGGAFAGVNA